MPDSRTLLAAREIIPMGSYCDVDADGFIVRKSSTASIKPQWWPVVARIIRAYNLMCGAALHSVYIRGSVAAGCAIDKVSDVDALAIVAGLGHIPRLSPAIERLIYAELECEFPFVTRFELLRRTIDDVRARRSLQMVILIQAVCVTGEDLAIECDRFKADRHAAFEYRVVLQNIDRWIQGLDAFVAPDAARQYSSAVAKAVLRTGFELVMERERRFTRDLYPCYESFCKYYPDRASDMREFLDLAVNPTHEVRVLARALTRCRGWLKAEIDKLLSDPVTTSEPLSSPRGHRVACQ